MGEGVGLSDDSGRHWKWEQAEKDREEAQEARRRSLDRKLSPETKQRIEERRRQSQERRRREYHLSRTPSGPHWDNEDVLNSEARAEIERSHAKKQYAEFDREPLWLFLSKGELIAYGVFQLSRLSTLFRRLPPKRYKNYSPLQWEEIKHKAKYPTLDTKPTIEELYPHAHPHHPDADRYLGRGCDWDRKQTIWPTTATMLATPFEDLVTPRLDKRDKQSRWIGLTYGTIVEGPLLRQAPSYISCTCRSKYDSTPFSGHKPECPLDRLFVVLIRADGRPMHFSIKFRTHTQGAQSRISFLEVRRLISHQLRLDDLLTLDIKWEGPETQWNELDNMHVGPRRLDLSDDCSLFKSGEYESKHHAPAISCRISQYLILELQSPRHLITTYRPVRSTTVGQFCSSFTALGKHRGGIMSLSHNGQLLDHDSARFSDLGLLPASHLVAREDASRCILCSGEPLKNPFHMGFVATNPKVDIGTARNCRVCRMCMQTWIALHLTPERCLCIKCPHCDEELQAVDIKMYSSCEGFVQWTSLQRERYEEECAVPIRLFESTNHKYQDTTPIHFQQRRHDVQETPHALELTRTWWKPKYGISIATEPDHSRFSWRWQGSKSWPTVKSCSIVTCSDTHASTKPLVRGPFGFSKDNPRTDHVFLDGGGGEGIVFSFETGQGIGRRSARTAYQLPKLDLIATRAAVARLLRIDDDNRIELRTCPATSDGQVKGLSPPRRDITSSLDHHTVVQYATDLYRTDTRSKDIQYGAWGLCYYVTDYLTLDFTLLRYSTTFTPRDDWTTWDVCSLAGDICGINPGELKLTHRGDNVPLTDTLLRRLAPRHGDVITVQIPTDRIERTRRSTSQTGFKHTHRKPEKA